MYVGLYTHVYVYIYICRQRERERETCIYVVGAWRVCAPVFSFTSGLFDSVFARVSGFEVFGFSEIIWAFRKFCFFRVFSF